MSKNELMVIEVVTVCATVTIVACLRFARWAASQAWPGNVDSGPPHLEQVDHEVALAAARARVLMLAKRVDATSWIFEGQEYRALREEYNDAKVTLDALKRRRH